MRPGYRLLLLAAAVMLTGCGWEMPSQKPPAYRTTAGDPRRDTELAGMLNARAVQLISQGCLAEAEVVLKDALAADLFHGPAHNNLGVVHFQQQKFYLAAWQFQYAARIMPAKAEPKNNLGLVFEAVGRLREAGEQFEQALALDPDNPEIIGNLAKTRIATNRKDEFTRQLLTDLVMKDSRPEWNAWARERLVLMDKPHPVASSQPDLW